MQRLHRDIHGFKTKGDPEGIEELLHKDDLVVRMLFTQAGELGTIVFHGRKDEPYNLTRLPDYTFEVAKGEKSESHL